MFGVVADAVVADPGATDPGATDPGATDPGATDPGAADPGAAEPGSLRAALQALLATVAGAAETSRGVAVTTGSADAPPEVATLGLGPDGDERSGSAVGLAAELADAVVHDPTPGEHVLLGPVSGLLSIPVRAPSGERLARLFLGAEPGTEAPDDFALDAAVQAAGRAAQTLLTARVRDRERSSRRAAETGAHRLSLLLDLTSALGGAHDVASVVDAICEGLSAGLGAATLYVGQVDEATRVMRSLGAAGLSHAALAKFPTYPLHAQLPGAQAYRTRAVVVIRNAADRDRRFPLLRSASLPLRAAYAVVPLLTQGRCTGIVALGWDEPGIPPEVDPALLEAIGSQCAQALERAGLYEAEAAARRRAERLAERLAILQDVTARLGEARFAPEVAQVITAYAAAGAGATCALLRRLDEATQTLVVIASRGLDAAQLAGLEAVPLAVRSPVSDAARDLRPVLIRDAAERDRLYPELAGRPFGKPSAYVALPLVTDDRALGALVLGWDGAPEMPGSELAFLLALARQSAQALDRSWAYEAEQGARWAAERTAGRLRLLQELTAHLSRAVDTAAVADVILRYATTALGARGAVLHRVDADSRCFVAVASHGAPVDPAFERVPLDGDAPMCQAVRTREPVLTAAGGLRPDADGMSAAAATAFVVVPLLLERRAVGALSVTWSAAVEYGTADAEILGAIASQCAQALDRARLYDESRSVARTLQGSLLPTRPPEVPGLEVAVRYRPISRRDEVGGDFYDVFRIAPGRWGVVIGDVSGKGVTAASLTALVRYTVRAASKRESSPADVLAFLNESVLDASAGSERFCTVAYLDLEFTATGAALRLAVGGHPLPVLRTASGEVRTVGRPGMAIGLLPVADVDDCDLALGPGDTLVLYTDGVTEARSPAGTFADELVEEVLARGGGGDAETIADRIERAALDFQAGDPRDDLAVVVLRVPIGAAVSRGRTASVAVTLDCDAASVGEARRVVRRFCAEQGLDDVEEVALLLTSEVVTNAVLHARTAVGLRVHAVRDRLRVEASDGSRDRPVRRDAGADATSGRGLLLLDRLSAAWDVRRTPDGKLVWFELDLPQTTARLPMP